MLYIQALPPKGKHATWTHTRFGKVIPKEKTPLKNLKDFFDNVNLTEEKLLQAMRIDDRVLIETENDKIENEKRIQKENENILKHEDKTKKNDKKRELKKEIEKFNEEKQRAQETKTKEDDKIVKAKEKELEKKIKGAENDSK